MPSLYSLNHLFLLYSSPCMSERAACSVRSPFGMTSNENDPLPVWNADRTMRCPRY